MTRDEPIWCGVDVGAAAKGFHVAAVGEDGLLAAPRQGLALAAALEWLVGHAPLFVAIDSPACAAPGGQTCRDGERRLARSVCGIRWTPDGAALAAQPTYYGWVLHGLELYAALAQRGVRTRECFPTASWTRWAGPRGRRSRADWTRAALLQTGLGPLPERSNQDQRDAIAAALTARAHGRGLTESYGEILVPRPGTAP